MSEFLSQDDIDALLQGGLGDDSGDSADAGGSADFIEDVAKDLSEKTVEVLNTLLGKEITFTLGESFIGDEKMISSKLGEGEYLSGDMPITGDITGSFFITLMKDKAAVISDLMMMGDGTAPYSDDVKDAVSEIYSQIAGSFASLLRDKSSKGASQGAVTIHDNDNVSTLIGEESIVVDLTIDGIDPFQIIMTFDDTLMRSLREMYGNKEDSSSSSFDMSGLLSQEEIDSITEAAEDMNNSSEETAYDVPTDDTSAPSASAPVFSSSLAPKGSVDMLLDIDLDISIELGRTDISIKRVLELAPGALVELDRLAGEPVDLMVNNKVVAKGEVVVVDESFGVRIISLVSPEERIKSLR